MKKYLKYGLPIGITLLLAWFLFRNGIQWSDLRAVLEQAKWGWLVMALLCTTCAYGSVTWLNEILLRRYDNSVPFRKQFLIQLAMAFVETVVPSAAISGVMLRARLLKPHGVSADVAAATTLVETALLSASVILPAVPVVFFALLAGIPGFVALSRWLLWVVPAIAILISIAIWKWNAPAFVQFKARLIEAAIRLWEQHIRSRWPRYFTRWPAARLIERMQYLWSESMASIRVHPYSILLSLVSHFFFEGLCLISCLTALGQRLPISTLLLLYPLTIAINTFGAVPGGVGLAEVSLSALYAQFGITVEVAVAVAFAYRLTGYWFPRVAGGLAWLWMERPNSSQPLPDSHP